MKRSRGLTLVEVLIAAVILFAVLSLSALTLKSLRSNSAQAEKVITLLQPVRMIVLSIQQKIRANPLQNLAGAGDINNITYQWQATLLSTASAPDRFDIDAGSSVVPPERFRLYQVTLQLTLDGRVEQLQYKEFAWLPLQ